MQKKQRERKCKNPACGEKYRPMNSLQRACSPDCAIALVQIDKAKAARKRALEYRKENKSIGELIGEAQKHFNHFIRLRDADKPCISCGNPLEWESLGGGYDAGHYLSRGARPELRFDERNCHAQCKRCNRHLDGNAPDYRIGLIERIGLPAVLNLEATKFVKKWTRQELIEVAAHYKLLAEEIQKAKDAGC